MSDRPPFCRTPAAVAAFKRWKTRVLAASAELTGADHYVLGLAASREARLEELAQDLARCKDESLRLRLASAERMAAQDMWKALELLERIYGAAPPVVEVPPRATGTAGRVVGFPAPTGLGVMSQRLVQAVRAHGPQTTAQLRAKVRGSQDDFLEGLKSARASGALIREGSGTKGRPYRYSAGESVNAGIR